MKAKKYTLMMTLDLPVIIVMTSKVLAVKMMKSGNKEEKASITENKLSSPV